eukprot:363211-Chlamydomonas_euryale.AAC.6
MQPLPIPQQPSNPYLLSPGCLTSSPPPPCSPAKKGTEAHVRSACLFGLPPAILSPSAPPIGPAPHLRPSIQFYTNVSWTCA